MEFWESAARTYSRGSEKTAYFVSSQPASRQCPFPRRLCPTGGIGDEQHAPEPEFVLIRNREFRTILPRDYLTEQFLNRMGLSDRQSKAVKFVKEHGRITNKEYQENFGLKKRQASDDLKELENIGVIKKVGTTGRGTYYVVRGAKGAKGAFFRLYF